jgi:LPS export ABC transporter protein LptC
MKKNILKILIVSLFGFYIMSSCQKKQDNIVADMEQTEYPDQQGWNSTVTSSKKGIVGAIIKYGHMQRFKKQKVVEFDSGIVVDFYDEQGSHTSNLTSNKGRLDEATNNIEAFGNVVVVSDTGITLKTERLKWDNSIEKIISNNFITIVTAEKDTFYGNGFESDQNLENWHITGFSGKASKGLDLDFQFKKKKQQTDSVSTITVADTLKDTTAVNR